MTPRSRRRATPWALVPVLAVGIPVVFAWVGTSDAEWVRLVGALGLCLGIGVGTTALAFRSSARSAAVPPALTDLQARLGGTIVARAPGSRFPDHRLRVDVDGIELLFRFLQAKAAGRVLRVAPVLRLATPDSWFVEVRVRDRAFRRTSGDEFATGHPMLDDAWWWYSDGPGQATRWLADPAVRESWVGLLHALGSQHRDDRDDRFSAALRKVAASRAVLLADRRRPDESGDGVRRGS